MKIALLGYGKMGKEIEKIALERNHHVLLVIDVNNAQDLNDENLKKVDVAIDFSTPASAYKNINQCFQSGVPVVCGTTGWLDRYDEIVTRCKNESQTFFYSSNFSLGVNIFFALNRYLARIMNNYSDYDIAVKEIHHIHKLDAPSGTALTLAKDIIATIDRKKNWELNQASDKSVINIQAVREGEVPGTHIITYDSAVDSIEISHTAKSRKGLALGAVLAAEFIQGKKGCYSMQDIIKLEA